MIQFSFAVRDVGQAVRLVNPLFRFLVCVLITGVAWAADSLAIGNLRCEYRTDPQGIDATVPRLSWNLTSDRRGEVQTAYRVLVASTPELLAKDQGDRWDSGKVVGDRSSQIEFAGSPLASRQRCYWKVQVWGRDGQPSVWSPPAQWTMGLLSANDWQARWIGHDAAYQVSPAAAADDQIFNVQKLKWVRMAGPDPSMGTSIHMRRTFVLPTERRVKRAVLALYAYHECAATVNGTAIGRAAHWEPTARLDATAALRSGDNVIALVISHTDPYQPAAIGRLVVQFESGADLVLPLDETWKVSPQAVAGWDRSGFDDAAWVAAQVIDGRPWKGPDAVADQPRLPASHLRKEFTITQAVKRATVSVTALGTYELRLNGNRIGQDVLAPGWTEFHKRVHYQTYDVTAQITTGTNAIGAILGDGWYSSNLAGVGHRNIYGGNPRLLVQMTLALADGSTQILTSDGSWKATSEGPIRHADLLMGCEIDARRVLTGWDSAGFDDHTWQAAVEDGVATKPGGKALVVQASVAEPSRIIEELPARAVSEPRPKTWTFDLGQNMVGWVRLKVRGVAGQRLTVRHGEMLNADGTIYTAALRSCTATDFFVLSGQGEEILEPYFTFHGFRYVEVRGLDAKPGLDAVTGLVVHTPMVRTGTFACSYPLLNQLYSNIIWGQKGNYLEVPTDCPQRDERMGWTGDTQFFAPTASYNFDVATFFSRWLQTCEDDQNKDGTFPHVVPALIHHGGSTAWGDAALLCTYNVYRVYGDTRVVAERFAALDRYMQWLATKTVDGISTVGGFGDWLNAGGGAPKEVMDTAYHAHLARIMSEMAAAIGRNDDAARYAKRHEEVKAAFVKRFLQEDGALKGSSQTGYALAFTMDLLPEDQRAKASDKFVEEIKRFQWHLATGFIGTPRLLPALSRAGRDDVAYRLLLTDTYPSWLFPVKNGATTMWERWNGWTPDKGFGDISMNSFNHYAFGAVGEYLYANVGGIQAASPGYRTITIKPTPGEGLTWAKTSFDSINGRIATSWKRDGEKLSLEVTIPANTTATVWVPAQDAATIREGGKPVAQAEGVKLIRQDGGCAVFAVGSGNYAFSVE